MEQAIHAAGALWSKVGEDNLILGWVFEVNAAKLGGKCPKTCWSRLLKSKKVAALMLPNIGIGWRRGNAIFKDYHLPPGTLSWRGNTNDKIKIALVSK